jgi:hypothetical protein
MFSTLALSSYSKPPHSGVACTAQEPPHPMAVEMEVRKTQEIGVSEFAGVANRPGIISDYDPGIFARFLI